MDDGTFHFVSGELELVRELNIRKVPFLVTGSLIGVVLIVCFVLHQKIREYDARVEKITLTESLGGHFLLAAEVRGMQRLSNGDILRLNVHDICSQKRLTIPAQIISLAGRELRADVTLPGRMIKCIGSDGEIFQE
jgi:hypothetical protein